MSMSLPQGLAAPAANAMALLGGALPFLQNLGRSALPHLLGMQNTANLYKAQMGARAHLENHELDRPNGGYGLNTSTPTVAIGAGATATLGPLNIEAGTTIKRITCNTADEAIFIVTSWKWNSTETMRGGPGLPLSPWLAYLQRRDNAVPLVLRKLTSQVTVTATIQNLSASPAFFHGFAIMTIDPGTACALHEVSTPERHQLGFIRIAAPARELLTRVTGNPEVYPSDARA
jgi:hypothetical protein